MDEDLKPTPGATASEKFKALDFHGADVSGVPDRALTAEETQEAIQAPRDAKSAKEWISAALGLAVKLGLKIVGA